MSSSVPPAPRTAGGSGEDEGGAVGLRSGLAVYTSLQASAQFADTKVGILGAVQVALAATAVPQGGVVREAWGRGGLGAGVAVALLVLHVAAFLPAVYCVVQALRPRLGPPPPRTGSACRCWPPPTAAPAAGRGQRAGGDLAADTGTGPGGDGQAPVHRPGVVWTGLMAVAAGLSFLAGPLLA
ncbi:hypothetical protein [Streptomyces sirii]|uniref:hypothetical protein n=1 Tax=Streptomyces sirii TaxID=3127701 RepID=UPI003D36A0B3